MNSEIKEILDIIENNGYEAFIIGGYVRDKLLGIESTDIDITTNALPKDLKELFVNYKASISLYGAFKIITNKYHFDITTYRKEISYKGRKPDQIEYVNNLIDDIKRRDITINTICMNKNGNIIDLLGGINDLNLKVIKCVGDADYKLKEDPLRVLRCLRFAITLNFKIDKSLLKAIKKNYELINTLSQVRLREELDRIIISKNVLNGLKILKSVGILKLLGISYNKVRYTDDLLGMYAQLSININNYFTNSEKRNIAKIKYIIKYKKIDNIILFDMGLYLSLVAGKIMNISSEKINHMYQKLPIKSTKDIKINAQEIMLILNIKPSSLIKIIQQDIKNKILLNKLSNDKDKIICYIVNNKRKWIHE